MSGTRWTLKGDSPGWLASWPGWEAAPVWVWSIERVGRVRTISVGVAVGVPLPEGLVPLPNGIAAESRQAIETHGQSALAGVLERDEPPARITITAAGLREESG